MIVFNAKRGNQAVYRLAGGGSFLPQEATVPGTLHCRRGIDHAFLHEFPQSAADFSKSGQIALYFAGSTNLAHLRLFEAAPNASDASCSSFATSLEVSLSRQALNLFQKIL